MKPYGQTVRDVLDFSQTDRVFVITYLKVIWISASVKIPQNPNFPFSLVEFLIKSCTHLDISSSLFIKKKK